MSSLPADESTAWMARLLQAVHELSHTGGPPEAYKARCEHERRRALAQLAESYREEHDGSARARASSHELRNFALARLEEWSA